MKKPRWDVKIHGHNPSYLSRGKEREGGVVRGTSTLLGKGEEGRQSIIFLKDFQGSPARPTGKSSIK